METKQIIEKSEALINGLVTEKNYKTLVDFAFYSYLCPVVMNHKS